MSEVPKLLVVRLSASVDVLVHPKEPETRWETLVFEAPSKRWTGAQSDQQQACISLLKKRNGHWSSHSFRAGEGLYK